MKAIVKNANQWCRAKMSMGQFAIDTLWMLLSYVRLIEPVMNDWKNIPSSQKWMPVTPDKERYFLPRLKREDYSFPGLESSFDA